MFIMGTVTVELDHLSKYSVIICISHKSFIKPILAFVVHSRSTGNREEKSVILNNTTLLTMQRTLVVIYFLANRNPPIIMVSTIQHELHVVVVG